MLVSVFNGECFMQALRHWTENGSEQPNKPTEAFADFRQWLCKCLSILEDEIL